MKLEHHLCLLKNGNTIISPDGKPISNEFYEYALGIVLKWVESECATTDYKKIMWYVDNRDIKNTALRIYDLIWDRKFGEKFRFLSDIPLAFIYVIGYYIDNSDDDLINYPLSCIMAGLLTFFLPYPSLIKDYLKRSFFQGCVEEDGFNYITFLLNEDKDFYSDNKPDYFEAYKCAEILLHNSSTKHIRCNGYLYALAAFRSAEVPLNKSLLIIKRQFKGKSIYEVDELDVESNTTELLSLVLLLEINAKYKQDVIPVDIDKMYEALISDTNQDYFKQKMIYWVAMNYIYGTNNNRQVEKGIYIIKNYITSKDLIKLAGATLAKIYLDGYYEIAPDYEEAYAIALYTYEKSEFSPARTRLGYQELVDIMNKACDYRDAKKLIAPLSKLYNLDIQYIDILKLKDLLISMVGKTEYNYLLDEHISEKAKQTLINAKNKEKIIDTFNNVFYIGAHKEDKLFYKPHEVNNIFICSHNPEEITTYMDEIIKHLNYKNMSDGWPIIEFRKLKNDTTKKRHLGVAGLFRKLETYKSLEKDIFVFIDSFDYLISRLDTQKQELLKEYMKLYNYHFICAAPNIDKYIDEYEDLVKTRICMQCDNLKEKSIKMVGDDITKVLNGQNHLFIKNESLFFYPRRLLIEGRDFLFKDS
mgnify:CR=1 FL=1